MLPALLAEFLGTFFFVAVILATAGAQPIAVAVALLAAIYLAASFSGGHINPAVSLAMFAKGTIGAPKLVGYVLSQAVGALLAVAWFVFAMSAKRR
jgi:glycerol uptake facilitator-like aquaporin